VSLTRSSYSFLPIVDIYLTFRARESTRASALEASARKVNAGSIMATNGQMMRSVRTVVDVSLTTRAFESFSAKTAKSIHQIRANRVVLTGKGKTLVDVSLASNACVA
jgi:hypothetical protein